MGVVANSAYQEGLALKANSADVIASSNPIGLNDLAADALSLSGIPVGGSGSAASQTIAGPIVFSGLTTFNSAMIGKVAVLTAAAHAGERYHAAALEPRQKIRTKEWFGIDYAIRSIAVE